MTRSVWAAAALVTALYIAVCVIGGIWIGELLRASEEWR